MGSGINGAGHGRGRYRFAFRLPIPNDHHRNVIFTAALPRHLRQQVGGFICGLLTEDVIDFPISHMPRQPIGTKQNDVSGQQRQRIQINLRFVF